MLVSDTAITAFYTSLAEEKPACSHYCEKMMRFFLTKAGTNISPLQFAQIFRDAEEEYFSKKPQVVGMSINMFYPSKERYAAAMTGILFC